MYYENSSVSKWDIWVEKKNKDNWYWTEGTRNSQQNRFEGTFLKIRVVALCFRVPQNFAEFMRAPRVGPLKRLHNSWKAQRTVPQIVA